MRIKSRSLSWANQSNKDSMDIINTRLGDIVTWLNNVSLSDDSVKFVGWNL